MEEAIEGEEGKESGEKIHVSCAHWNVNGMFVVEETHDKQSIRNQTGSPLTPI